MGIRFIPLSCIIIFLLTGGCTTLPPMERELSRIPNLLVVGNDAILTMKWDASSASPKRVSYEGGISYIQLNVSDLIMDAFAEQIYEGMPYWPDMEKAEAPRKRSITNGRAVADGEHYIMGFDVSSVILNEDSGAFSIEIHGVASIVDPRDKLILLQYFHYDSKDHKRFIAYDFKSEDTNPRLQEEARFGAGIIASDLVNKIKNREVMIFSGVEDKLRFFPF